MIDHIVIFSGSKRDFEDILEKRVKKVEKTITFLELIQLYNARIRPGESGVKEDALLKKVNVDNCIVRSEDYGSVLEHVLPNFVNVLVAHHNIKTLYVHNAPKQVVASIESRFDEDEIEYLFSEYPPIDREILQKVYTNLNKDIIGQNDCKQQLLSRFISFIFNRGTEASGIVIIWPIWCWKNRNSQEH